MTIATIILAAGRSGRLGQPKQLLKQDGQTLIRRMTEAALSLNAGPVLAVLGANADPIRAEIAGLPIQIVLNDDWQTGMASSLRAGLIALANESVDAFMVILTDQPYVTPDLLQQLIDAYQKTDRGIVACQYNEPDHLGVPALFDIRYKPDFLALTGDTGARKLIRHYAHDCTTVPFPLGHVDLDTPDDLAHWQVG